MKACEKTDQMKKKAKCLVLATAGVYLAFRFLLPLCWPFLLALLAASLLRPAVRFLHRKFRIPLGIGSFIFSVLLLGGLGTAAYFLGRLLFGQIAAFLSNLDWYLGMLENGMCDMCEWADEVLELPDGTAMDSVSKGLRNAGTWLGTNVFEGIGSKTVEMVSFLAKLLTFLLVFLIATVLILKEMLGEEEAEKPEDGEYEVLHWISCVKEQLSMIGLAYLRTQSILLMIITAIISTGLLLIGNRYALLIGLGIGIMDAFPVLGSGMILIPWGILGFFKGNYLQGIVLLIVYLICQFTRELLEPRLLGNRIGIKPIYTLIAMYTGLKLFGVIGFLLGPLGLVLIRAVMKSEPLG